MRHGDISNRESPILAFNMDNLMFINKHQDKGVFRKVLSKISSRHLKVASSNLNNSFIKSLETLWDSYSYSIYLVTQQPYTGDLELLFSELGICYTRLIYVSSMEDLRVLCQNRCTYYFDNDLSILSYMSSPKASHIKDLWAKVGEA